MTKFESWAFTPLRSWAETEAGGRLRGTQTLTLTDLDTNVTRDKPATYELYGPADVATLSRTAIARRYPMPGIRDAEETKLVFVEFGSADLPWRYTPAKPDAKRHVPPWVVVVVGTPLDVVRVGDRRVTLSVKAQTDHPLDRSWQWAHVHDDEAGRRVARVMSPVDLVQDTEYVACVVPAYPRWTGAGPVTVDCYDSWTFRTGPEGDFPDLAEKLHTADLTGKTVGQAEIRYRRRGSGTPSTISLTTFGALKLVDAAPAPAAPAWIADEVSALTQRVVSPDGRVVVSAPRYSRPFVPSGPATGSWVQQLTADPRSRGTAGLGAWAAIEWQDRISAAAAIRAGDLEIARDRVAHLAFGLTAARSLWRRHVPADAVGRLAVLAPVLGRLPTETGASVLDAISGRTPRFTRALFSSAARRALRPGPARTDSAAAGAAEPRAVLTVAAECAPEPPQLEVDHDALRDAANAMPADDPFREDLLAAVGNPDTALGLDHLRHLDERMRRYRPECRGVDLDSLGTKVSDAVDPTLPRPVLIDRVLDDLPGVDGIGPIEIEPELDLPIWKFLDECSPDWLLPGADELEDGDVVALSTNPEFVGAMLTGANHQALGELRWRNMPVRPRWSPMRKFWQRKSGAMDIRPIKEWAANEILGAPAHSEYVPNQEAVVLFRTPLFRRYPATVVYLYEAQDWTAPEADKPLDPNRRVDPVFTGTIGDDITFFGFPIAPSALSGYWVVLEEPPAGFRFYHPNHQDDPPADITDTLDVMSAANYAKYTFALPVRVLIGPLLKATP